MPEKPKIIAMGDSIYTETYEPPAVSEAMREAVATFARAAAGLPASVPDQAPVARISADAIHPGTITTITAGDLRAIASEIARLTKEVAYLAGDRDDAREGERRWALRCGTVLGKTPEHDAPAEPGRLGFVTMSGRHEQSAWESIPAEARQRWAYVEGAYLTRWDADRNRLTGEAFEYQQESLAILRQSRRADEKRIIAEERCRTLEAQEADLRKTAALWQDKAAGYAERATAAEAALSRLQADRRLDGVEHNGMPEVRHG